MSSQARDEAIAPRRLPLLPRGPAFWGAAVVLVVLLGGSAAVSPLYGVDQKAWHFSSAALTSVFAVYALALLVVLLFAGSLSDLVGRRPMMTIGLVAEAGAAALLISAHGLAFLYGARLLQGVATGAAVGAIGAQLIDLQPSRRPALGATVNATASNLALAAAAFGASVLIQYGPAPTRLVFWLLLAASVAGLAVVAMLPETVERRVALRPRHLRPRAGLPVGARRAFLAAVPALVAPWALGGLYFSLGPSLAGELIGSPNLVWGGLVIFLLAGSGGVATLLLRKVEPRSAMGWGGAVLALGSAVTVGAILAHSAAGLLAGTSIAGAGFGMSFLGAFRLLAALATPGERGALLGTAYVVAYLSFSLPAIAAGVAATHVGLQATSIVFGAIVAVLALVAAVAGVRTPRRPRLAALPRPDTCSAGRESA